MFWAFKSSLGVPILAFLTNFFQKLGKFYSNSGHTGGHFGIGHSIGNQVIFVPMPMRMSTFKELVI